MSGELVKLGDGELLTVSGNGQEWMISWHGPEERPEGVNHGSGGVCVGEGGQLVLISHDGVHWGFPAGRPEGDESLEETLRREMQEEACVKVTQARLLGFMRGECVAGHQLGVVLARAYWRAEVEIGEWEPQFEIEHRRVVSSARARDEVVEPDVVLQRLALRILAEAGLG